MPQERENTGKRLLEVFLISLYLGLSSFGGAGDTSRVLPCRIREKQEIDNGRAFQRPCGTLPISSGSCQQPGRHSDWSLPGGAAGSGACLDRLHSAILICPVFCLLRLS